MMSGERSLGPSILWGELKGKKVMSNDGKEIGEIEKVSKYYLRLEKGSIKKESFWIPKYLADAFDGKVLWLIADDEEIYGKYHYGEEPSIEQYQNDFDSYKSSSYGKNSSNDSENVKVTNERTVRMPSKLADSEEYKNIRDLEDKSV